MSDWSVRGSEKGLGNVGIPTWGAARHRHGRGFSFGALTALGMWGAAAQRLGRPCAECWEPSRKTRGRAQWPLATDREMEQTRGRRRTEALFPEKEPLLKFLDRNDCAGFLCALLPRRPRWPSASSSFLLQRPRHCFGTQVPTVCALEAFYDRRDVSLRQP